MSESRGTPPEEPERVVIRDKRRIDPVTGEARPGAAQAAPGTAAPQSTAEPVAEAGQVPMVEAALLDERTADLQRLQAEYANYRKRADRERLAAGEVAVSRVLTDLLPVLDDIDRARQHGDLNGALKAVADHLEGIVGKLGLEEFGEVGDEFDPAIHEAVLHDESDTVTAPTCTTVMRRGYRHGERLLRPAMVGVTDPTPPAFLAGQAAAAEVPAEGEASSHAEQIPPDAGAPSSDGDTGPNGESATPGE